jgi:hypothetical protein
MIIMHVRESVCPARYQCYVVSEMVFEYDRLYINLSGHTLKGFAT